MIVRISRAHVLAGVESEVFDLLREAADRGPRPPGLEAVFIGRQMDSTGPELVAITVWADVEQMVAAMGKAWNKPAWMPGLERFVTDGSVEHLETVVESFESLQRLGRAAAGD